MVVNDIKPYIGNEGMSIVDVMKMIDNNAFGALIIVDDEATLIGAVSDGDIRRWLIKTGNMDVTISMIMNRNPKYVTESDIAKADSIMDEYLVTLLPVINNERKVLSVVLSEKQGLQYVFENKNLKGIPLVVMAGGKGTRLYPYTKVLPKPLIPINDIPIAERIINEFCKYGINNVYMTLNYKKEMIKSYFNELNPEYEIQYIEERKPLGTAGAMTLLENLNSEYVIVTNCDILIRADYSDIINHHKKMNNAMTVVSAIKKTVIPYGVIKTSEDGQIKSIDEKPSLNYAINSGMYIINTEMISRIPHDMFYHMTDFMDDLLKVGERVGIYPISDDSFLDMGEFSEMQRMEEKLRDTFM